MIEGNILSLWSGKLHHQLPFVHSINMNLLHNNAPILNCCPKRI